MEKTEIKEVFGAIGRWGIYTHMDTVQKRKKPKKKKSKQSLTKEEGREYIWKHNTIEKNKYEIHGPLRAFAPARNV